MKKIYLFAAAIVAVMTVSCGETNKANGGDGGSSVATSASTGNYDGIVYINTDSLITGYQMYKDLSAEFNIKAEKVQKELTAKGANFETQYKTLQNKIDKGLITRYEAEQQAGTLEKEQQTLLGYRDSKLRELQEQEAVMTNNISENIRQYIEKYNQTKKYKMILTTSAATNVVVAADPSIDITVDVLNGLNSEYNANNKK